MRWLVLAISLCVSTACSKPASKDRLEATYDKRGALSQLTINGARDGKPNVISYMNGTRFVRIEIDSDEDGKIDRWEYYGPDQKLSRIGFSRSNDGIADAWATPVDGALSKLEVSTKHDGKVNRTEFYEAGRLTGAEEDTDADGRVDRWEKYASGELVSVSFDTVKSGKPTTTVDYGK